MKKIKKFYSTTIKFWICKNRNNEDLVLFDKKCITNLGDDYKVREITIPNTGFLIKIDDNFDNNYNYSYLAYRNYYNNSRKIFISNKLIDKKEYPLYISNEILISLLVSGIQLDKNNYLMGTYSLLIKKDSTVIFIPETSTFNKNLINISNIVESKRGTTKWTPGYIYINKRTFQKYLYIGTFNNWIDMNYSRGLLDKPETCSLFVRISDEIEHLDIIKSSSNLNEFLINLILISGIYETCNWAEFFYINYNKTRPSLVEGIKLFDSGFNLDDWKNDSISLGFKQNNKTNKLFKYCNYNFIRYLTVLMSLSEDNNNFNITNKQLCRFILKSKKKAVFDYTISSGFNLHSEKLNKFYEIAKLGAQNG